MKTILFFCLIIFYSNLQAQSDKSTLPFGNVRFSFLLFPPISPLLTLEMRTIDKFTIQFETNFINTHGVNLKYFINQRMDGHFMFMGTAFLKNDFLRNDNQITILPYAGYGYAHRFSASKSWIFDNKLGIGQTLNADKKSIYPVLKSGIGRTF